MTDVNLSFVISASAPPPCRNQSPEEDKQRGKGEDAGGFSVDGFAAGMLAADPRPGRCQDQSRME